MSSRALCLAVPLTLVAGARAQSLSILAWEQTPYPTLPAGVTFWSPATDATATIAADGTTAFIGILLGAQTGAAVLMASPAGPVILVREGDAAPGSGGLNFGPPQRAIAGPGGRAAIAVTLTPTNGSGNSLYLRDPSGLQPLMIGGQSAPGAPGFTFYQAMNFVAAPGAAAFYTGLQPSGGGVWGGALGNLGPLARLGDQAQGFGPGRQYIAFTLAPAMNASGTALFRATVGPISGQDLALYAGTPGSLSILYLTGQPAPGIPNGTFCLGNGVPVTSAINAAGDAVFGATVCDSATSRRSMWAAVGHTLSPVMVEGDPVPGLGEVYYGPLGINGNTEPVITDSRRVAFVANLTGPSVTSANNTAILAGTPGNLRVVARTGDPAPGFAPGAVITNFSAFGVPGTIFAINAREQVVFPANVNDNGQSYAVLYYADPAGRISRVLNWNQPISFPGSTGLETLSTFNLYPAISNGPSGRAAWLNDAGQVVMRVQISIPATQPRRAIALLQLPDPCYANCDLSTTPPVLNVQDFSCFLNRFASGDPAANCDLSTVPPVLNIADFSCFLNAFASGCS